MTVFIKIKEVNEIKEVYLVLTKEGILFVAGSKAGVIATPLLQVGDNTLPKTFLVMCGNDDNLIFRLCKNVKEY
jgi:tryptophanyl-tRNA synthetase